MRIGFVLAALWVSAGMAHAVDILVIGNSYTSYNGGNKSAKILEACIQEDVGPWGFTPCPR